MAKPDKIFASELDGREVMDLRAGEVIGAVMDFCVTRQGTVTQIGVLPLQWFRGGRGIAPGSVANIVEERLSIDDAGKLEDFASNGEDQLSYLYDNVLGKEVLQHDGEMLGGLVDFAFSVNDGRITDVVVLSGDNDQQTIAVDEISTIGRNYMVVTRAGAGGTPPGPKRAAPSVQREDAAGTAPVAETATSAATAVADRPAETPEVPIVTSGESQAASAAAPAAVTEAAAPVAPSKPVTTTRPTPTRKPKEVEDVEQGGAAVVAEPVITEAPPVIEEASAPFAAAEVAPAPVRSLDELKLTGLDRRKAEFLLDKSAHRDVTGADGQRLLARGDRFSVDSIEELQRNGLLTEVFIEMTSHKE